MNAILLSIEKIKIKSWDKVFKHWEIPALVLLLCF